MSKRNNRTFRLAFLKNKIHSTFKSEALKAALLKELEERGEDAALVVQMIEKVKPVGDPPVQAVIPVPSPTAPAPRQPVQPGPAPAPRQAPVTDGNSAETAVDVLDSEDEVVQDMHLTPRRERRLRERLQAWRSSSSE